METGLDGEETVELGLFLGYEWAFWSSDELPEGALLNIVEGSFFKSSMLLRRDLHRRKIAQVPVSASFIDGRPTDVLVDADITVVSKGSVFGAAMGQLATKARSGTSRAGSG